MKKFLNVILIIVLIILTIVNTGCFKSNGMPNSSNYQTVGEFKKAITKDLRYKKDDKYFIVNVEESKYTEIKYTLTFQTYMTPWGLIPVKSEYVSHSVNYEKQDGNNVIYSGFVIVKPNIYPSFWQYGTIAESYYEESDIITSIIVGNTTYNIYKAEPNESSGFFVYKEDSAICFSARGVIDDYYHVIYNWFIEDETLKETATKDDFIDHITPVLETMYDIMR